MNLLYAYYCICLCTFFSDSLLLERLDIKKILKIAHQVRVSMIIDMKKICLI